MYVKEKKKTRKTCSQPSSLVYAFTTLTWNVHHRPYDPHTTHPPTHPPTHTTFFEALQQVHPSLHGTRTLLYVSRSIKFEDRTALLRKKK
jgi:hypothetical protein